MKPLIFYFFAIFSVNAFCENSTTGHERAVAGVSDIVIAEADRPHMEDSALRGDATSAFKLYRYDYFRGRTQDALFWARISAENNHPAGAYSYGFLLAKQEDFHSKLRAEFWLKKASEDGDELARKELERLLKK